MSEGIRVEYVPFRKPCFGVDGCVSVMLTIANIFYLLSKNVRNLQLRSLPPFDT